MKNKIPKYKKLRYVVIAITIASFFLSFLAMYITYTTKAPSLENSTFSDIGQMGAVVPAIIGIFLSAITLIAYIKSEDTTRQESEKTYLQLLKTKSSLELIIISLAHSFRINPNAANNNPKFIFEYLKATLSNIKNSIFTNISESMLINIFVNKSEHNGHDVFMAIAKIMFIINEFEKPISLEDYEKYGNYIIDLVNTINLFMEIINKFTNLDDVESEIIIAMNNNNTVIKDLINELMNRFNTNEG